jgi:hypothetical protein
MNLAALSTTQIIIIIAVAAVVVLAIVATALSIRKRRTEKLRTRFGGAEYTRAVTEGGNQQKAEAALNARAARVVTFLMSSILCSEWQLRGGGRKNGEFSESARRRHRRTSAANKNPPRPLRAKSPPPHSHPTQQCVQFHSDASRNTDASNQLLGDQKSLQVSENKQLPPNSNQLCLTVLTRPNDPAPNQPPPPSVTIPRTQKKTRKCGMLPSATNPEPEIACHNARAHQKFSEISMRKIQSKYFPRARTRILESDGGGSPRQTAQKN